MKTFTPCGVHAPSRGGWLLGLWLLLLAPLAASHAADTAFFPSPTSRLFASSGVDLTTAVAAGPDGSAYYAGTFIGTINGSAGNLTSNAGGQPDIFVTKLLPDGSTGWLIKLGGVLTDKAECLAVDPVSGRAFVAGQFAGTATFGSTNLTAEAGNDGFVACLETDGTVSWVRQIKGVGDETVFDLKVGTDGLHICGSYNSSASMGSQSFTTSSGAVCMYLVKTDLEGVPVAGVYPASTQSIQPRRIVLLADGTRVIAGQFTGTLLFGGFRASNGVGDFFVSAYAANGTLSWLVTGGGTENDRAYSLIPSAAGDLLVGLSVEASGSGQVTDINGNQSLSLSATGSRVARISAAGAYTPLLAVNGAQLPSLAEGQHGVLHLAGNFLASVTLGTTTVTSSSGQQTAFLASYLSSGALAGVSVLSGGSSGPCLVLDMALTSADGVALAGRTASHLKINDQPQVTGSSDADAFTVLFVPPELHLKLSRQGNQVRVTYPVYHHSTEIWESTTLGSWTKVPTASTLTLGEMQKDFDGTEAKRFFQLRYSP